MWNAGLDEAQAGIKIAGRNVYNLRCADDNTFMAKRKQGKNQKYVYKKDLYMNIS